MGIGPPPKKQSATPSSKSLRYFSDSAFRASPCHTAHELFLGGLHPRNAPTSPTERGRHEIRRLYACIILRFAIHITHKLVLQHPPGISFRFSPTCWLQLSFSVSSSTVAAFASHYLVLELVAPSLGASGKACCSDHCHLVSDSVPDLLLDD